FSHSAVSNPLLRMLRPICRFGHRWWYAQRQSCPTLHHAGPNVVSGPIKPASRDFLLLSRLHISPRQPDGLDQFTLGDELDGTIDAFHDPVQAPALKDSLADVLDGDLTAFGVDGAGGSRLALDSDEVTARLKTVVQPGNAALAVQIQRRHDLVIGRRVSV